jgi:hypothetical protein
VDGAHFVINTHDVDILPAGVLPSLYRLGKYALISLIVFRRAQQAAVQALRAFTVVGGRNPLDQVPELVRTERRRGVGASYFFIAAHKHRRDGNYRIADPKVGALMRGIEALGMEVALHGSYTSLEAPDSLAAELRQLRDQRVRPRGNRQHWLRFTLDRLIPAVERSGALYDASLGWDCPGFRAGACFAFPPYNFDRESAATFLEIPLAVMEQGLVTGGLPEEQWLEECERILAASRRYGWGGISLLWHPTAFGGVQLPREIERTFWRLVDRRHAWHDTWVSALEFVRRTSGRYVRVGLLPPGFGSGLPAPSRGEARSERVLLT